MSYTLSVDFPVKVTNCYDCPLLVRRQRDFNTPMVHGVLSYVERTTLVVATCGITNEELDVAKKVGDKWDKCPLTVRENEG